MTKQSWERITNAPLVTSSHVCGWTLMRRESLRRILIEVEPYETAMKPERDTENKAVEGYEADATDVNRETGTRGRWLSGLRLAVTTLVVVLLIAACSIRAAQQQLLNASVLSLPSYHLLWIGD